MQAVDVAVGLATSRTARCCRRGSLVRWSIVSTTVSSVLLLAAQLLGPLRLVPDLRVLERGVDLVQPQRFAVVVKDTPGGRPVRCVRSASVLPMALMCSTSMVLLCSAARIFSRARGVPPHRPERHRGIEPAGFLGEGLCGACANCQTTCKWAQRRCAHHGLPHVACSASLNHPAGHPLVPLLALLGQGAAVRAGWRAPSRDNFFYQLLVTCDEPVHGGRAIAHAAQSLSTGQVPFHHLHAGGRVQLSSCLPSAVI